MSKYKYSGHLLVLLAATLWATLGLFYHNLVSNYGLSLFAIIYWRAIIAALVLWLTLIIFRRSQLLIAKHDWGLFFLLGLLGIAGFYIAYITAISLTGMGVAAVLLYTAPIWVMIYSTTVLKEKMNTRKIIALLFSIIGIILVGRVFAFQSAQLNTSGIIAGLLSGLGYAAYIILNKYALQRKYSPWLISAYGLGIGGVFLLFFQTPVEQWFILSTPLLIFWLVILGVLPTLGGAVAFNAGLNNLPASTASVIATLEPVIATLLGWFFFAEKVNVYQVIGGCLIITAVVVLQAGTKENQNNPG
jgi:DME family drug/metabolite transporter